MADDGGGAGANLGNFKGVMLCNRPAQIPRSYQVQPGAVNSLSSSRPAFSSAVVPESALGLRPIRKPRERKAETRNRADDVTWRHKKWLTEFQAQRSEQASDNEIADSDREERKKRFQERSAQVRAIIRSVSVTPDGSVRPPPAEAVHAVLTAAATTPSSIPLSHPSSSSSVPFTPSYAADSASSPPSAYEPALVSPAAAPAPRARAAPVESSGSRPAWALSADAFVQREEDEADALVEFAQQLDFDRYMDDVEVREAVKFVKTKVREMEDQKQSEAEAQAAAEAEAAGGGDEEQQYGGGGGGGSSSRRTRVPDRFGPSSGLEPTLGAAASATAGAPPATPARALLDGSKTLRAVHSSQSVARVADSERARGSTPGESVQRSALAATGATVVGGVSHAVPSPIISVHKDRSDHRSKSVDPSNLPFLHRHPAV